VIVPPGGVRVLVASRPVDFRKGIDGLAALAKETLAQDPFSGTILVFRAKRADRVKLLFWDRSGLLLVSKRLEQAAFKWPPIGGADRRTGLDTRACAASAAATGDPMSVRQVASLIL
jgi:transposase